MLVEQGTDAWLEMRRNRIGSSDAPCIMGVGYQSAYRLAKQKLGLLPSTYVNKAMQRGKDLEPLALAEFANMTGFNLNPDVIIPKGKDWLIASMDGIDCERKIAVEIKCPTRLDDHYAALDGKIPERYMPQLQHQMNCCDLEMIYYFSFDGTSGIIVEVGRNDSYIVELEEKEFLFWRGLQELELPAPLYGDLREVDNPRSLEVLDAILERKRIIEKAEKEEKELRKEFIELENGQDCRGRGATIVKTTTRGSVDYSSIPELRGVDLNKYRKPSYDKWVIRWEK